MVFKKGTKIYSIANGKCPKCHKGKFFTHGITFNPSKITQIHDTCSHCNLKYMIEPSFFYGAMYINYGITVAISVTIFLIAKLGFQFDLLNSFFTVLAALIITAPLNLRLSRILWINMFISYNEKAFEDSNNKKV